MKELLHALQIEVQDRWLESQDTSIEIYFDTFDVRRALLGMLDYVERIEGGKLVVNFAEFEKEGALIAALLDSGRLGPVRMLQPHQAELRRQLENNEAFVNPSKWSSQQGTEFLGKLGLLRPPGSQPKHVALGELSHEELDEFVRFHSENAPRLFKAVQCVRSSWWGRLERWKRDGVLQLETPGFDALALTRKIEFPKILEAFRKVREASGASKADSSRPPPLTSYNDFADAVALAGILTLVEDFEAGRRKSVPRFYDSHGSFRKVADIVDLTARLRVRSGGDGKAPALETSVLVDATYLAYKASFRVADTEEGDHGLTASDLYGLVSRIVAEESPERLSALKSLMVGDKRALEIVEDLVGFGFLRNVWLKTAALKELQEWIERLRTEATEIRTAEYQQAVTRILESTKATLDRNAKDYYELGVIWIQLDKSIQEMLRDMDFSQDEEIDPVREFKLLRFDLSDESEPRIRTIVNDLMKRPLSAEERRAHGSWHKLVEGYSLAAGGGHPEDAEVAAAVLWCFPSFNAIRRLLRCYVTPVKADRVSLGLMFAAACFDNYQSIGEGRRTMRELQNAHAKLRNDRGLRSRNGSRGFIRLSVGLAYLHFHLWRLERQDWDWRRHDMGHEHLSQSARSIIERAIDYATDACEAIPDDGPLDLQMRQLQRYAQNQRLFYLLELGDDARDREIRDAVLPMRAGSPRDVWMSTFDDTLARYYHFRAVWTETESSWSELMDSALERSKAANKGTRVDAVVRDFKDYLSDARANGFEARKEARVASRPPPKVK